MPCFKAQHFICGQNKKKTLLNTYSYFTKNGPSWGGCDCCMYQGLNQLGEDENCFTAYVRDHTLSVVQAKTA